MSAQAPAAIYYPPVNSAAYPTYAPQHQNGYVQQPDMTNWQADGDYNDSNDLHGRDATQDSGYYGPGPAHPAAGAVGQEQNGRKHNHPHLMTTDADYGPYAQTDFAQKEKKRLSKKWQRRLYWLVPLCILLIAIVVLFEVYKEDFLRWAQPLTDWLRARKDWSWIVRACLRIGSEVSADLPLLPFQIPVAVLFVLSFPPLFGHEVVQLIVGLVYPIGVAIGIACAGAILGEAGCFFLFKYGFTGYVDRKCRKDQKWAVTRRVAQKEGFRGVMIIRYSIIPPRRLSLLFFKQCTDQIDVRPCKPAVCLDRHGLLAVSPQGL